jgi:hypothetical protein
VPPAIEAKQSILGQGAHCSGHDGIKGVGLVSFCMTCENDEFSKGLLSGLGFGHADGGRRRPALCPQDLSGRTLDFADPRRIFTVPLIQGPEMRHLSSVPMQRTVSIYVRPFEFSMHAGHVSSLYFQLVHVARPGRQG